jgi:hypothetical protein
VLGVTTGKIVRVADGRHLSRAQEHRHGAHPGAGHERACAAGAEIDDLGTELVPHHHRSPALEALTGNASRLREELVAMLEGMQVRSADSTGERFYEHLARHRLWADDVFGDDCVATHHRCTHDSSRLSSVRGRARIISVAR